MNIFRKLFESKVAPTEHVDTSFLGICKENYLKGIRPANDATRRSKNYQMTVSVAKQLMSNDKEVEFAGYFGEAQYLINLWAAHLILEYGGPSDDLTKECLDIIIRYSSTPLDETLAREESEWIDNYNYVREINFKADRLKLMLKTTIEHYNTLGCPCSFPRYRQIAGISCSDFGDSFYVAETEGLINESKIFFDEKDIPPHPEVTRQIWTCKKCQSTYEFGWRDFSISVNRSYLKIKELKAVDIGRPPITPIPMFIGAFGHSTPNGLFTQYTFDEMNDYLKG
jgi:hypothetical protein